MALDIARRAVLIDMAYEIGGQGLAGFTKLLTAVRYGNWASAAAELKTSLLFTQVPIREQRNMMILAFGEFPAGVTSGEDLTKKNGGCIFTPRPDANGKWEIGWGHDIPVPQDNMCWTQDQCDAQFIIDYTLAEQRAEADLGSQYW